MHTQQYLPISSCCIQYTMYANLCNPAWPCDAIPQQVQHNNRSFHDIIEVKDKSNERNYGDVFYPSNTSHATTMKMQHPDAPLPSPTASNGRRLLQTSRVSRIDTLVVMTNRAVQWAGSTSAAADIARVSVAVTNKVLRDSAVNAFANIVGFRHASSYDDSKTGTGVLDDVSNGKVPGVNEWRDEVRSFRHLFCVYIDAQCLQWQSSGLIPRNILISTNITKLIMAT